jgi:hypothetical protein
MMRTLFVCALILLFHVWMMPSALQAWNSHPLLTAGAMQHHTYWSKLDKVPAFSLETFLTQTAHELEEFLARHEIWSRNNLPYYAPLPEGLTFRTTDIHEDIVTRFFHAIRINPEMNNRLYQYRLPGAPPLERERLHIEELTFLSDVRSWQFNTYVRLHEGEMVHPFDVLITATDEPDFGFDLGLFEDNGTEFGRLYGFGKQSFGNPNLEYSSQALFHMGFYHEAGILYKAGPFLRKTWLDYRIFLYMALAEFAFANDQPYWGWRFAGWGMHYAGDVSMPYHVKPLPGVSTCRMIRINTLAIMGMPRARNNAVQLVSNRHTVFEALQLELIQNAMEGSNSDHPILLALATPSDPVIYTPQFLWDQASAESARASIEVDRILSRHMPPFLVNEPKVEVGDFSELFQLSAVISREKGHEALQELTDMIAIRLKVHSFHVNSYLHTIMERSGLLN